MAPDSIITRSGSVKRTYGYQYPQSAESGTSIPAALPRPFPSWWAASELRAPVARAPKSGCRNSCLPPGVAFFSRRRRRSPSRAACRRRWCPASCLRGCRCRSPAARRVTP